MVSVDKKKSKEIINDEEDQNLLTLEISVWNCCSEMG
jgi:hypothetical protein